jgi:hypothetical protein
MKSILILPFIAAGTPGAFSAPAGVAPVLNGTSGAIDNTVVVLRWKQLQQALYTNTNLYNGYVAQINAISAGSLASYAAQIIAQAPSDEFFQICLELSLATTVGTWGPQLTSALQAQLITGLQNEITAFQTQYQSILHAAGLV